MARAKKKTKILPTTANAAAAALSEYYDDDIAVEGDLEAVKDEFPPVLFSNAVHGNVFATSLASRQNSASVAVVNDGPAASPRKRKNGKENETFAPVASISKHGQQGALTEDQAKLWLHKFAAGASLQPHHFPRNVFRLLGSITRWVDQATPPATNGKKTPKPPHQCIQVKKRKNAEPSKASTNKKQAGIRKMTPAMAKREALVDLEDGLIDETQLGSQSKAILQAWLSLSDEAAASKSSPLDGWNRADGSLQDANDQRYVSIHNLLRWMEKESVIDRHAEEHCSLYHGLKHIPVDTKSILEALLDLSSPEGLYHIPLIMPFAVVTKAGHEPSHQPWKISIAVYAHRLLPEVMSSGPLHTVMSALDPGTYKCVQSIELPPATQEVIFESSKFPIVVMEGEHNEDDAEEVDGVKDETDMDEAESKKDDDKATDDNLTAAKSKAPSAPEATRDEQSISAFTTKGLLKLLESPGNDTSNWPNLQSKILPHLKLQLMLHQEHAICWMAQMESLGGFGINSVLWETREFWDGGKYYYSPALGQIRLRPPPLMKGGMLCDEMGLGKTVEVLGLILATLDDLKQEVALSGKDDSYVAWHATLIIVPPALVYQWLDEIRKATGDSLVVDFLDFKTAAFVPSSTKRAERGTSPDIVVTTYTALERPDAAKILSSTAWGRVVLDEMQQIRQSTSKIACNCEQLTCHRRWMLSGTPLFEGIDDLRGELNFLRLEPFSAALEDGFFKFAISNHWDRCDVTAFETIRVLGLFLLRRSKSMTIRATGAPIMGLKPLTVEFVPIPQSLSERALYCFLEYVLAHELRDSSHERAPPKLCLRLLRDLCISTVSFLNDFNVTHPVCSLAFFCAKSTNDRRC
jgi:hypothetical protein